MTRICRSATRLTALGFIFSSMSLFSMSAAAGKSDMVCIDKQNACMQICLQKSDMSCIERCGVDAQKCLEAESDAKNPQAAQSGSRSSGNSSTNLEGCWRSDSKLTTWCFNGSTSTITTDSYAGRSDGQRITELAEVTTSGSSMTYYIVRAKQTGSGGYDRAVRKGPYTQPYTYSDTRTPSFYAAGDQYVKQ